MAFWNCSSDLTEATADLKQLMTFFTPVVKKITKNLCSMYIEN